MRLILILLFSLSFYSLQAQAQAQAQQPSDTTKASFAVQWTNNTYGGFAEVFIKPNTSLWTTFTFERWGKTLGFGEDTTGVFSFPEETVVYPHDQRKIAIRAGVRIYEGSFKEQWFFWYSPVVGYTDISQPSAAFLEDYERDDLHFSSRSYTQTEYDRFLELGGEVGTRWAFWRKLYADGSMLLVSRRSLIGKTNQMSVGLDLRLALGITF